MIQVLGQFTGSHFTLHFTHHISHASKSHLCWTGFFAPDFSLLFCALIVRQVRAARCSLPSSKSCAGQEAARPTPGLGQLVLALVLILVHVLVHVLVQIPVLDLVLFLVHGKGLSLPLVPAIQTRAWLGQAGLAPPAST